MSTSSLLDEIKKQVERAFKDLEFDLVFSTSNALKI